MAAATLTLAGGNARPALPAALSTAPTILALDLGTTTGWALRAHDGLITSGTVSFRPSRYDGGGMRYLRFTNWLTELDQLSGPIAAIWYEEVRRHVGHRRRARLWRADGDADRVGRAPRRALPGRAGRDHQDRTPPARAMPPKEAMIAAARARGFNPTDDNEADALAILLWAIETRGGVR